MASAEQSVFTHGVASFEPTTSGVLLWTRLNGGREHAEWQLSSDPGMRDVVASGNAQTDHDRDHTVVIEIDGLEPANTYWYRFTSGGETSPLGRTRTLPGRGAERFTIATVCCSHYAIAPLGVYRAVAETEVDLVLHLGDYIYEDDGSNGPRGHEPPRMITSLDDYRRRIAQMRADPDTRALHQRHPMVTIWDDHDLADNAWRTGAKKHDDDEHGPWPDRVAAAAQARREWLPSRLRSPDQPLVTWRSTAIGDLAELLLLDTRYTGRDRQAGDDGSPDLDDPERSLLGDEQRTWLRERLADVDRPWAILASGVVVNEIELSWPPPLRWFNRMLPNGYAVLDGRILHDDQWDGYPAERDRLVRAVQDRAAHGGRTVILSGDVHSSWAFAGPCDPDTGQAVAVEMTTPAVSSAAMGRAHYPGIWRILDRAVNRLDHVRWADVTERGFGILELTRAAATSTWWFVHPYAEDPAADAVPAATFRTTVEDWPPRFEPVEPPDPADGLRSTGDRRRASEPLPARPADLGRLRSRRRMRLAAEATAWTVGCLAPVAVVAAIVRWRRNTGSGGRRPY